MSVEFAAWDTLDPNAQDKLNAGGESLPQTGQEIVLTVKLTIAEDLDADWLLYSERSQA